MGTKAAKTKRPAKPAPRPAPEQTKGTPYTAEIVTRLRPKDAAALTKAATIDERSRMQYLRRLIEQHLQQLRNNGAKL
jgi:hypothetical protein